jgi:hypothetical protein
MPRVLRRTSFTFASAISLLVCIGLLALWVRSTMKLDRIRSSMPTRRTTIHSKNGEIYIDMATASAAIWHPGYQHIHALPTQFRPPDPRWEIAGLGGGSETVYERDVVIHRQFAEVPLWPIVVVLLILPVMWCDRRTRPRGQIPLDAACDDLRKVAT